MDSLPCSQRHRGTQTRPQLPEISLPPSKDWARGLKNRAGFDAHQAAAKTKLGDTEGRGWRRDCARIESWNLERIPAY